MPTVFADVILLHAHDPKCPCRVSRVWPADGHVALEVAFRCLRKHKERLKKSGLELQLNKTKCYMKESRKNQAYHEAKGNIEEGSIKDDEGNILKGLRVYGIPIGSEEYVRQFLKEEATRICKDISSTNMIILNFPSH